MFSMGLCSPLVHLDFVGGVGEVCSLTTIIVVMFMHGGFSIDRIDLGLGLVALAEHLEGAYGLFRVVDMHESRFQCAQERYPMRHKFRDFSLSWETP